MIKEYLPLGQSKADKNRDYGYKVFPDGYTEAWGRTSIPVEGYNQRNINGVASYAHYREIIYPVPIQAVSFSATIEGDKFEAQQNHYGRYVTVYDRMDGVDNNPSGMTLAVTSICLNVPVTVYWRVSGFIKE